MAVIGVAFCAVRTVQRIPGLLNIVLMGLNVRDGVKLTGRLSS